MSRIILYIGFIFIVISAGGQTKEELQLEKQKAMEDIELTKQLIEKAEQERLNSVRQVRLLDRGIRTREKLIKTIESEVSILSNDIAALELRINELEKRKERYLKEYATIIYFAYRNHTEYEKLMYLLASSSISQAYQRYKYLRYLTDYRKKVVNEIESLLEQLKNQKDELNNLRNEKLKLLEQKENESKRLEREKGQRTSVIKKLQEEEVRLRAQMREKERIKEELEEEIRRIIEEEARKMNARNLYASLTPEQRLVSAEFAKNKGKLPWPVERGVITMAFGNADYPGLKGTKIKSNGIDISGMPGSKARAIFDGEVTKVFAILGANYTVLVRHGDFLSVYQNLVNVRVKTGDSVKTKQVIGDIFTEQKESVATIHFEIWQERNILDPEEWLSR
ncbi:MAG: peptidoglycan DD-metalloendopeptidase family protein [Bacteroidales bacterium]|nr:peptidoglycan DD-metalloendopeptidase family protein [Bacteroidales bacterium]MBN2699203.1 peptidoglycan DD-metalloendopeptidase family protein [Bacteroidales bacterium]